VWLLFHFLGAQNSPLVHRRMSGRRYMKTAPCLAPACLTEDVLLSFQCVVRGLERHAGDQQCNFRRIRGSWHARSRHQMVWHKNLVEFSRCLDVEGKWESNLRAIEGNHCSPRLMVQYCRYCYCPRHRRKDTRPLRCGSQLNGHTYRMPTGKYARNWGRPWRRTNYSIRQAD